MIGDGPELEPLGQRATPGVSFLGRIDRGEVRERLARAHVLVATSIREGWGLNVSEAAACGTPAIGYSVPGLADSISSSGGALVAPRPAALADALAEFFAGRLPLEPAISTVPWSEVAARIERRLEEVIRERRSGA
jgi:glycosyltransferase involved in cell wall biosynthesis